jgi:outer membrane protein assembly factor BamB
MIARFAIAWSIFLSFSSTTIAQGLEDQLFAAARRGDAAAVAELLRSGVDVNAKTRYGVTALTYASRHGHTDVVQALLAAGADVNAADTFYHGTPLSSAASEGHGDVVRLLLAKGAGDLDGALENAIYGGSAEIVGMILDAGPVRPQTARSALRLAESLKKDDVLARLKEKLVEIPAPVAVSAETLATYAGQYASERGGEYEVEAKDGSLLIGRKGGSGVQVEPKNAATFLHFNLEFAFEQRENGPMVMVRRSGDSVLRFEKIAASENTSTPGSSGTPEQTIPEDLAAMVNWPQFRGAGALGIAAGQPPVRWDATKNENVRWKTPIPGLAHSCPIVWDDKIFVTTAVRLEGEAGVRTGVYGDVTPVDDNSPHSWQVYCLQKEMGEVIWERTAHEGVPRVKRHPKSTHANSTPVTDGKHVVAFFASEGLYCYDFDGKLLWNKDLGVMDSGWFYDPDAQWGFASSPILFEGMVIVQCDRQKESFIAAYRVTDGAEVWRKDRDEIPTWTTPTVCRTPVGPILVTAGTNNAIAYDPQTGEELWRLKDHSEIAVPTPFFANGLIFVASGYRPIKPIYAIRPTARGDLSLPENATSSEHIAWSRHWGGPYTPTPLVYGEHLYVCDNEGILACYEAGAGKQVYRNRLRSGGAASFSASPVAADGRLYFTSEEGVVLVVAAGPKFELLATNPLGEECLATPAISDRLFIARTKGHVTAFGE